VGERGGRKGEGVAARENQMREIEGGGGGVPGAHGRTGPGRAGLGHGPGRKPTTHTTTDRNPFANRNPKRGETDARLNTTSDKRNMLRHDATPMST
jgi:hypothetical protein